MQRALGWMLAPIAVVQRDPHSLLDRPITVMARIREQGVRSLEARIAAGGPEGLLRDMFAMFEAIPASEWSKAEAMMWTSIRADRRRIARHRSGSDLLALFDAAEQRVRNVALLALLDPVKHPMGVLNAYRHLHALSGARGEDRALLLLSATSSVVEGVYAPYLEALWKLVHVVGGAVAPARPALGRLVQVLHERLGTYPTLVEAEAAHFRNAIVHNQATYIPGQHAFEMHDANGWRRVVGVRDLEAATRRMFSVAGELYSKATSGLVLQALVPPLFSTMPELGRAVTSGEAVAIELRAAEFQRSVDEVWADILRFHEEQQGAA